MSSESPRRDVPRRMAHAVAVGAMGLVLLSVVLRLTVRDRVPGLAVVFYATPLALDAAGAFFAAFLFLRSRRRRAAAVCAAIALSCAGTHVASSYRFADPRPPGALRGVHWNVAHGTRGWPEIAAALAALDPDVAWLVETDDEPSFDDAFRAAFPGRTLVHGRSGHVIVARGDAVYVDHAAIQSRSRLERARLVVKGRAFESVQVNVVSSPFARRLQVFDDVLVYVEPRLASPLLVVGDFNTPRDSVAFDAWRGPLTHAFESTGRGLDATWPVPLPLLSIDHVWSGGGLAVRTCELPWTWRSDHLPVVFTFDVP